MESIKVSVILTTYNSICYIEDSLAGILNQNFDSYEVIIIDDSSSDDTYSFLCKTVAGDPKVILLRNESNRGAGFSRNLGLSIARGEFVIFLDDDDFFHKSMLSTCYQTAKRNDLDMLVFGCQGYDHQNKVFYPIDWTIDQEILPKNLVFSSDEVVNRFNLFSWWSWDKFFKRDFLIRNSLLFQEIPSTNDLFFTMTAYLSSNRISVLKDILISYRTNRVDSVTYSREKNYQCLPDALLAVKKFIISRGFGNDVQVTFFNYMIGLLHWGLHSLTTPSAFYNMHNIIINVISDSEFDEGDILSQHIKSNYNDMVTMTSFELAMKSMERIKHDLNKKNSDNVNLKSKVIDLENAQKLSIVKINESERKLMELNVIVDNLTCKITELNKYKKTNESYLGALILERNSLLQITERPIIRFIYRIMLLMDNIFGRACNKI